MSDTTFPIMTRWNDKRPERLLCIPLKMIEAHVNQCFRNHNQSVERLAFRGGLDAAEAVAVLEDRAWVMMSDAAAESRLRELVAAWEQVQP